MKKGISLVLALVMCLSLCACGGGNKDNVRHALQGSWVVKVSMLGETISRYCTFNGNKYTASSVYDSRKFATDTGTFEVREDTIHLIPDDGSSAKDFDYSYNKDNGTLILWFSDGLQFEKGK